MRKIMDFANVAFTVLLGCYLFLLPVFALFGSGRLTTVPVWLSSSGGLLFLCFVLGAFLVAANVCILVKELKAGGLRRNLQITTDHGQNKLSISALEMMLLRDLRAQPDILEPIVRLHPKPEGKPMLCELELKLKRQNDVIKRMDGIKRQIRETFDRLIPGGITVEVQAEVRDLVEDYPKTKEKAPEGEFNGPVYADSDSDENFS